MGSVRIKKTLGDGSFKIPNTWKHGMKGKLTSFQILLIGPVKSGKSCIVYQFINDKFVEDYEPTISDTFKKQFEIENEVLTLNITDTSGAEETLSLKGIDGVIFVYGVDSTDSFLEVKKSYYKLVKSLKEVKFCPFLLVGNKCDLEAKRQVFYEQGLEFSKHMNAPFFETSAKTGKNVERVFLELVKEISFVRTGGNSFPSELKELKPNKSRSYTLVENVFGSQSLPQYEVPKERNIPHSRTDDGTVSYEKKSRTNITTGKCSIM